MRRTIASLMLGGALLTAPCLTHAATAGEEVLFSGLAAAANLFYVPAKVGMAAVGLPVGALLGAMTGGNTRAAYAVWVPTVGGSYFLTPDQMTGRHDLEFFGADYADRPSAYWGTHHGSVMYDSVGAVR